MSFLLELEALKQAIFTPPKIVHFWIGDNDYGAKVSSGLYFLSVKAGNSIKTAKILLLK